MSSIEAVMLTICVFWDVTQHQLFLTFHRNVAFILKDPCTLEERGHYIAVKCQRPLTQQHTFTS